MWWLSPGLPKLSTCLACCDNLIARNDWVQIENSSTLDLIYEAALLPSKWMPVLNNLARSIGAEGTLLFSAHEGASRSIVSEGIVDLVESFNAEGWDARNARAARLLAKSESGFVSDFDLFTEEEMLQQPMYSEFLRPKGFGWGAATSLQTVNGHTMVFSIEKRFKHGPVDESAIAYLNRLRPHLARSAFLGSQLEFQRITTAVNAMQISGLAAAVLSAAGDVLVANLSFENLAPQVCIGAFQRLKFASRPANERLGAAFDKTRRNNRALSSTSGSFTLPQHEGHPPAVVHLLPMCGDARDIFARAAFFLIVTPIDRQRVPSTQVIQELFDLTPAEARVAIFLAGGMDAKGVAKKLSLSQDTVRSHIRGILTKSDMPRQTDFVAAVASLRHIATVDRH